MDSDHLAVIGAAQEAVQLDTELGKAIGVEDACFRYVPDSSGFYNVPNGKLLFFFFFSFFSETGFLCIALAVLELTL